MYPHGGFPSQGYPSRTDEWNVMFIFKKCIWCNAWPLTPYGIQVGNGTKQNADTYMVTNGLGIPSQHGVLCEALHEIHEPPLASGVREEDLGPRQVHGTLRSRTWRMQVTFSFLINVIKDLHLNLNPSKQHGVIKKYVSEVCTQNDLGPNCSACGTSSTRFMIVSARRRTSAPPELWSFLRLNEHFSCSVVKHKGIYEYKSKGGVQKMER